jgi:putative PIN family toxin of toxin-antitoxin system
MVSDTILLMKLVVDTNVLVSALRSRRGAAYRLLRTIRRRGIPLAISVALVLEYEDALSRPGMIPDIPQPALLRFIDALVALAEHQAVYFMWRPYLPDPKDDMVLEVAVAAAATHLVTYNGHDFRGAERFGLMVVTPIEMLRQLGEL